MKLAEMLKGRESRKVGNNTYVVKRGDAVALRLHQTDIITEENDCWRVNSGGWRTHTTKDRLNSYLPVRIYQNRGVWFWNNGKPFSDGDTVSFTGEVTAQAKEDSAKAQAKERRKVLAFARKCSESLPLPMPSNGDCWYCLMQTESGDSLGDASHNHDHIKSHIDEGYIVPSMVLRALREANCGDLILASAFGKADGLAHIAKPYVRRAVAKYIYRRLGMAS